MQNNPKIANLANCHLDSTVSLCIFNLQRTKIVIEINEAVLACKGVYKETKLKSKLHVKNFVRERVAKVKSKSKFDQPLKFNEKEKLFQLVTFRPDNKEPGKSANICKHKKVYQETFMF